MSSSHDVSIRWRDWLAPHYWPTWLGLGFLWLLTRLPLDALLATGRMLGPLTIKLIPDRARVVKRNLDLALPDGNHHDLARRSSRHAGMALMETSWLWFRRADAFQARISIEGGEHLDSALASGRGVILLQAHFSMIDICAPFVSATWPASAVYDPPKNAFFRELQVRNRCKYLDSVVSNDDVRGMVRRLRNGKILWFSPDQAVSPKRGAIATTFFGQPVLTSTGTARLISMSGAKLVPMVPWRSDDGSQYRIRFEPAVDLDTHDILAATQRVNDILETHVKQQPEQYLWVHKRFKPPTSLTPNPYAAMS